MKNKYIPHCQNSSKIVERCKIDIPNTQTHDRRLSGHVRDTSITHGAHIEIYRNKLRQGSKTGHKILSEE